MSFFKCKGTSPPSDVTAVQDGPTSIRVSWTPSSDATGYRIHYTSSRGYSGSEDVSGEHSDSHTLTGLVKEDTYTISIMATFHTLSSNPITVEITLSEEDPLIQLLIIFVLSFPSPSSRCGECVSELHNSLLHLPLLECGQWLSGQLGGGVERD